MIKTNKFSGIFKEINSPNKYKQLILKSLL